MNTLIRSVNHLLGGDTVIEEEVHKEREIHVKLAKMPVLDGAKKETIKQAFIAKPNDECDVRVRESVMGGKTTYTMTAKYRPKEDECETEITKECFEALFNKGESKQEKTRHHWRGWMVDLFSDGGVVAEFEYNKKSDIPKFPEDWEVVEESDDA